MNEQTETKRQEYKSRISSHFLMAIMYSDESGLDTEDKGQLTEWLAQFEGAVDVCLAYDETDPDCEFREESYFGVCDICGLHSNVYDVTVIETL